MVIPSDGREEKPQGINLQKGATSRNDTQRQILTLIEGLETQMREQFLKQNEQLKKISQLSKIEDRETLILERLERIESKMAGGAPAPPKPIQELVSTKEEFYIPLKTKARQKF